MVEAVVVESTVAMEVKFKIPLPLLDWSPPVSIRTAAALTSGCCPMVVARGKLTWFVSGTEASIGGGGTCRFLLFGATAVRILCVMCRLRFCPLIV